jgi:hypothetical protein
MAEYRSIALYELPEWLADDDAEFHDRALAVYDSMVRAGIVNDYDGFVVLCEESDHAIRRDDFKYYAEEYAYDIGAIGAHVGRASWPTYCIDWEWAAQELLHDYAQFDFDGDVYCVLTR